MDHDGSAIYRDSYCGFGVYRRADLLSRGQGKKDFRQIGNKEAFDLVIESSGALHNESAEPSHRRMVQNRERAPTLFERGSMTNRELMTAFVLCVVIIVCCV
jgi:hypothetical protein